VPPGIADSLTPNPVFSLVPSATVDEGNNWINVSWGPLSLTNPSVVGPDGNFGAAAPLANYALRAAIDTVPTSETYPGTAIALPYPRTDFFGNARAETAGDTRFDPGAIEFGSTVPVFNASLTPAVWNISHARNCPGTGILGILACLLDPAQVLTLTNTGTEPITGITQGTLSGTATDLANFTVVRLLSTCGPAGGGQFSGITTLAPGATCVVWVQFKPLTAQPAGVHTVTLSVSDSAGTQTSTLNGTGQ
jgi:hypothetical protein